MPVVAEEADGAAVGAAAGGLEFFDDLHGADLRSAGDAAAGEGGAQEIDEGDAVAQCAFDGGDAVVDGGMRFDFARGSDAHGADVADPSQIVALQVDDHVRPGRQTGGECL